ncbi:MAG: hypothetical protein MUF81_20095 [Verrucomicrobia bacterium]|jgi:ribosome-associated translation inhibitor RaiA|nr:hypothetical protein [Verrucomicrobiota bacterium]
MNTTMRLNVQHLKIRSPHRLGDWVERQILALGAGWQSDEANIRLERRPEISPAHEVPVHLVTRGTDVIAGSRDHTMRAAFAKVMVQLRDQIGSRIVRRLQRLKSKLSAPAARARSTRFA